MNEFFEFIKGWWGLIVTLTVYALCGAWWGGRIQKDVDNLKAGKFVTKENCKELQQAIKDQSNIQFAAGNTQFIEIKKMIADNDKASTDRHFEIMNILREMSR